MTDSTRAAWDSVIALLTGETLKLGPVSTDRYVLDPKRLCFFLSRYKFAAKMLRDCQRIADIGCGDGIGTLILLSDTKATIQGIDFDTVQIEYANKTLVPLLQKVRPADEGRIEFRAFDFVRAAPLTPPFDGVVSLDVIEHIEPDKADTFLAGITASLSDRGVAVIGTPNDFASAYASAHSQAGHINLYEPDRLREALQQHFSRVFLFSMNDEMVHTGFDKMAHYLIALAVK